MCRRFYELSESAGLGHGLRKMRHKRVVVTQYGGPEVITVVEEDVPNPKVGEVRVKVSAAALASLMIELRRPDDHPTHRHGMSRPSAALAKKMLKLTM